MTTSRAKAAGSAAERVVAHALGGERVGQMGGPVDVVVEGYMDIQVKTLRTLPSLAAIIAMLTAIPKGERLRSAVVITRPGAGSRAVRTITFDLDEFAAWHGSEPLEDHADDVAARNRRSVERTKALGPRQRLPPGADRRLSEVRADRS